jgi:hypothetical protein
MLLWVISKKLTMLAYKLFLRKNYTSKYIKIIVIKNNKEPEGEKEKKWNLLYKTH